MVFLPPPLTFKITFFFFLGGFSPPPPPPASPSWSFVPASCFSFHGSTTLVGLGFLFVEVSLSPSDAKHPVVLLRTKEQPDAETSKWQHATLTREIYICPRRDSNPQSHQASVRTPTKYTARPLVSASKLSITHYLPAVSGGCSCPYFVSIEYLF